MKTATCLALGALALVGCNGSPKAATTTVGGFTVDIDLLAGTYAKNPSISAGDLVKAACVPSTPVYALYADGTQSETVMADASCDYTVTVKENTTVHMVAAMAGTVMNTYSQDNTVVGTTQVTGIPAHVCTSNPYAAPMGLASLLTIGTDEIQSHGVCMFGTNDIFTAPFVKLTPSTTTVSPSSFTVYAMTNPGATPPTFVQQADSPVGIHALYDASNSSPVTLTVSSTADSGPNTYAPFACDVKPGFVTFGPENPNS